MASEQNFTAAQALKVLRRRWLSVLCLLIIVPAAVFFLCHHQGKQYTATASVLFTSQTTAEQLVGIQSNYQTDPAVAQATNAQLMQLGDVPHASAAAVGHGLTTAAVRSAVAIEPSETTNIVQVSATTASPALSAELANAYCHIFATQQEVQSRAEYASALKVTSGQLAALTRAQRASATGLALQSREQSLALLLSANTAPVKVVQSAEVPTVPSSPKTLRNTVLAAFLGLLLGIALAFTRERLDQAIREPQELADIYGLPLLGVVPQSSALSERATRKSKTGVIYSAEPETFHLLNAHLRYFNVDRPLRTVLIASALPATGKTTIATHLAGAAARLGNRVLLLEADMRRPAMARRFGLTQRVGLAEVLIGIATFAELVQRVAVPLASDGTTNAVKTCDVLTAGLAEPPNPGELMSSQAMASLLSHTRSAYDVVIIDCPPINAVSDVYPLLQQVDGVVVVGRVSHDRRDSAREAAEVLRNTGANVLGVIANGVRGSAAKPYAHYRSSRAARKSPGINVSKPGEVQEAVRKL